MDSNRCFGGKSLLVIVTCLVYSASAGSVFLPRNVDECGHKPADVIFVLDASSSIWVVDFNKQLQFVQNIVENFQIAKTAVRVGVMTFATYPRSQFPLNQYTQKDQLLEAIGAIQQTGGDTYTAEALEFARSKMFDWESGARGKAAKIVIVITDGNSHEPSATAREALKLRRRIGAHVFAIGVGNAEDISDAELNAISSNPDELYSFRVGNYNALGGITSRLAKKTCEADVIVSTLAPTRPPFPRRKTTTTTPLPPVTTVPTTTSTERSSTTTTEKPSGDSAGACGRPTDVVFLVDSDSAGPEDNSRTMTFIKNLVNDLDIGADKFRVAIIHECAELPGFQLNTYFDKRAMLRAFGASSSTSKMPYLIERMRTRSFSTAQGGRTGTRQVGVILTNQRSGTMSRTIQEAQRARHNKIELIGIGVGRNVDPIELSAMVSCPEADKTHIVSDFGKLPAIRRKVLEQIKNC